MKRLAKILFISDEKVECPPYPKKIFPPEESGGNLFNP